MKTLSQNELRKKVADKKWIMAYNKLDAIVDKNTGKVMYIETYGPVGGFFIEGWRALHYKRTSPLVERTYREGATTICILKQGTKKLQLIPSFSPLGIESCSVRGNKVFITFAGLGGAGVSASFSRGLAKGVLGVQMLKEGGGAQIGKSTIILPKKRMLLVGVDDTDNEKQGATFSLVHNIATEVSKKYHLEYLIHVNVQHYPYNSKKTRNCMSTVVGIIFSSDKDKKNIIEYFKTQLKRNSYSLQTAMAVYEGFVFNEEFLEFSNDTKFGIVDVETALKACKSQGVTIYRITGNNGIIGAAASLGYFDKPDFAAKLPSLCQ
jgi:methanogenesis imperfect marker protein 11